jgi:aryl-alcohol dehydrogenase-like predicted oxidoreductase
MNNNKFCLGTAKFDSSSYGLSSNNEDRNLEDIFHQCKLININNFDTSPRYGNAEEMLGKFIDKYNIKHNFISTKIDNLKEKDINSEDIIKNSVLNSLNLIKIEKLDLVYLHQNDLGIISDKFILKGLEKLKSENLIGEIGASIYTLEELDFVLKCDVFDWIQIPMNVLDTFFYNYILNSKYKKKIAARSIFLQGLIPNYNKISKINYENEIRESLNILKTIVEKTGLSYISVIVSYIFSLEKLSMIILGTSSCQNIKNNYEYSNIKLSKETIAEINELSCNQALWTNPRLWYN